MKKNLALILSFCIVWACIAGLCYLLNLLTDRNRFADGWQEYAIIGFAGALASVFGPILAAWIDKFFKRKS